MPAPKIVKDEDFDLFDGDFEFDDALTEDNDGDEVIESPPKPDKLQEDNEDDDGSENPYSVGKTKKVSTPKKKSTNIKEEEEEEEDDDSFFDDDDLTDPEDTEGSDTEVSGEPSEYKTFAKALFEHGGIDWNDEYLKDDSPEGVVQLFYDLIEANSEPQYANDTVREFDQYVKAGGDPKRFLETYYIQTELPDLDLQQPEHQKYVLFEHLRDSTKWSDKKIQMYIERLGADELSAESAEAYDEVKASYNNKRQALQEEQQKAKQAAQAKQQEEVATVVKFIKTATAEDLGGIEMSLPKKKKFAEWLLRPDKDGKTGYNKKLDTIPNIGIKLAALVFEGATEGKLGDIASTKAVNQLKDKLSGKKTKPFTKSTNKAQVKSKQGDNDFDIFDSF